MKQTGPFEVPETMCWDEEGDMMDDESEDESESGDGGDSVGSLGEGAGEGITMRGDRVWILEAVGLDFTDVHEEDLLAAGTCLPVAR